MTETVQDEEFLQIVAVIESFKTAYAINEFLLERGNRVTEDVSLSISARIETIGRRHEHFVGRQLGFVLGGCRDFGADREEREDGNEFSNSLLLNGDKCFGGVSVPLTSIWGIRSLLDSTEGLRLGICYQLPEDCGPEIVGVFGTGACIEGFYIAPEARDEAWYGCV